MSLVISDPEEVVYVCDLSTKAGSIDRFTRCIDPRPQPTPTCKRSPRRTARNGGGGDDDDKEEGATGLRRGKAAGSERKAPAEETRANATARTAPSALKGDALRSIMVAVPGGVCCCCCSVSDVFRSDRAR